MKTTERKDVYGIINATIIEKLEQGVLPWNQTWNSFGPARNYISNKAYRGINAMLLNNTKSEYPLFITFNQVKDLGGTVRKGSKGNMVVFWKKLYYGKEGKIDMRKLCDHAPEDVTTIPLLRYYYVFNIDCVEGVDFKLPEKNILLTPLESCERIITGMPKPPVVEHGGDEPSYNWGLDRISMPHLDNFQSTEEYYATFFHELAHSTGHPTRLNRPDKQARKEYSFEELIAETTACFLCNEAGIADKIIDNSASYIKHWLIIVKDIVKEDERFLVRAFAQAQFAADYILDITHEETEEAKAETALEEKGA